MDRRCFIAVIAIDFDDTLVFVTQPLDCAKEAVNRLREKGHKIVIHTCNREAHVKQVLDNNDIRYDRIHGNESKGKPRADIYVDNNGFRFSGVWNNDINYILQAVEGIDNKKW